MKWAWLADEGRYTRGFLIRVLLKAAVLFVLANLIFALLNPLPAIGRASVYGWLVPPRLRLPYGENSAEAYNLSLNSLDAMFATHILARPKAADEYRVLVLGDSATWGILLRPNETLTGVLNARNLQTDDGKRMVFYNIGYPTMSLTKDLMLLNYAMSYQPDALLWVFTAQSFPRESQAASPIVQYNAETVQRLIADYQLNLDAADERFVSPTFWDRTLVGGRRPLADWLRLQLYGFAWATTAIDQYYPDPYTPHTVDFDEDISWGDFETPESLAESDLSFEVLSAGIERAGGIPVLLVNEPMFISDGVNSNLRYNAFYPRWAYDAYREWLLENAAQNDWPLLDLWDAVDNTEFTDSPVHLTPEGVEQMSEAVIAALP
ncbi:MAG: hypothetical protein K8I30_06795 [Anaerolineae bacterium]|nr:hypothetical protein [Anaerolineae bacterium]